MTSTTRLATHELIINNIYYLYIMNAAHKPFRIELGSHTLCQ